MQITGYQNFNHSKVTLSLIRKSGFFLSLFFFFSFFFEDFSRKQRCINCFREKESSEWERKGERDREKIQWITVDFFECGNHGNINIFDWLKIARIFFLPTNIYMIYMIYIYEYPWTSDCFNDLYLRIFNPDFQNRNYYIQEHFISPFLSKDSFDSHIFRFFSLTFPSIFRIFCLLAIRSQKLQSNITMINFVGIKSSTALNKWYQKLFDLSFIDILLENGLNIHLNQERDQNITDRKFWIQLIWTLSLQIISIHIFIASWITWDDTRYNPIYTGNFFIGFGVPKNVVLTIFMIAIITVTVIECIISYQVYAHDHYLEYLLELVKTVSGKSNQKVDYGMDPRVIDTLRKEMIRVISFLHFFLSTIHGSKIAGFFVAFISCSIISLDNLTTWKLILTLIWSIYFMFWIDQVVWTCCSSFMVVIMICRFFFLAVTQMNQDMNIHNSKGNENVGMKKIFYGQLIQSMYLVHYIRRYNISIRLIIGISVSLFFSTIIYLFFSVFFVPLPKLIMIIFLIYGVIFIFILIIMIKIIGDVSFVMKKKSQSLFKLNHTLDWKMRIKDRINIIIQEMNHNSSLDCYCFIPNVGYLFIIQVSAS